MEITITTCTSAGGYTWTSSTGGTSYWTCKTGLGINVLATGIVFSENTTTFTFTKARMNTTSASYNTDVQIDGVSIGIIGWSSEKTITYNIPSTYLDGEPHIISMTGGIAGFYRMFESCYFNV